MLVLYYELYILTKSLNSFDRFHHPKHFAKESMVKKIWVAASSCSSGANGPFGEHECSHNGCCRWCELVSLLLLSFDLIISPNLLKEPSLRATGSIHIESVKSIAFGNNCDDDDNSDDEQLLLLCRINIERPICSSGIWIDSSIQFSLILNVWATAPSRDLCKIKYALSVFLG